MKTEEPKVYGPVFVKILYSDFLTSDYDYTKLHYLTGNAFSRGISSIAHVNEYYTAEEKAEFIKNTATFKSKEEADKIIRELNEDYDRNLAQYSVHGAHRVYRADEHPAQIVSDLVDL